MKIFGKAIMLVLLLGAVGTGGFIVGNETALNGGGFPLGNKEGGENVVRMIQNLTRYRNTIQSDFLFDYSDEDLENGIYKGLFQGLNDPYSEYYTPEEYQALMEETTGQFAGVGLVVSTGEDNLITVVSPIANTPAAKAGIRSGDKIVEIDGEPYDGTQLQEASEHMRGEPNTKVDLTIYREGEKGLQTLNFTIVREMIEMDTVIGKKLEPDIGYVQITSFDEVTSEDFKNEWEKLEQQGAKRFVLDLRNNPGGLLTTCEDIADMLLGEATIVTTVDKNGYAEESTSDVNQYSEPIVVLANEGSASASEILLGALRDNHRATSVGTKTFGKGIVQRLYPLGNNGDQGGFKLTMAEYLTPSGEKIHGKGITPDTVVPMPEDAEGMGPDFLDSDPQLQKALEEVKSL